MLPFILSGLFALAQCLPTASVPTALEIRSLTPNLARDLAVFKDFKKDVSGPRNIISNWTSDDVCKWDGVFCAENPDTKRNSLAGLDFNQDELTGKYTLTGFLDKLLDIVFFHANSNGFSDIPNLSGLKYLVELDLSNNKYSGNFPKAFLTAPGLVFLDLRFNNFQGALPGKVFSAMRDLDTLFLNDNQFSGEIPDSIGSFPGRYLTLMNNQFHGSIPKSLARAKHLEELVMYNNKLSGDIPFGLNALSNLKLFNASYNELTGKIPEDLCSIQKLEKLVLKNNKLSSHLGPNCTKLKKAGILEL